MSYESYDTTFLWGLNKHPSDKRFYDLLGGLDIQSRSASISDLLKNDPMVTFEPYWIYYPFINPFRSLHNDKSYQYTLLSLFIQFSRNSKKNDSQRILFSNKPMTTHYQQLDFQWICLKRWIFKILWKTIWYLHFKINFYGFFHNKVKCSRAVKIKNLIIFVAWRFQNKCRYYSQLVGIEQPRRIYLRLQFWQFLFQVPPCTSKWSGQQGSGHQTDGRRPRRTHG